MSAVLYPHRLEAVDLDDELRVLLDDVPEGPVEGVPGKAATARVVAFRAPAAGSRGPARIGPRRRAGSRGARYARPPQLAGWVLTRRGELVVHWSIALATLVVAALVLTAAGFAVVRAAEGRSATTRVVQVEPGQSIWSIASTTDPRADPGETVATIQRLNGLDDAPVVPGQRLVVPVTR